MLIDVIITGGTTPTAHFPAWDFASVPNSIRPVPKARRATCWQTWVADTATLPPAKRSVTKRAHGTVGTLRHHRHDGRRMREMNLHVATEFLPDHRQTMAYYCNAALRRRRRSLPACHRRPTAKHQLRWNTAHGQRDQNSTRSGRQQRDTKDRTRIVRHMPCRHSNRCNHPKRLLVVWKYPARRHRAFSKS